MKLQDQFPYDSTILGLENLYIVDYEGNFLINSSAILTQGKTVVRNNTYLLIESLEGKNGKMYPVTFMDAYYKDGVSYLFVQDLLTNEIFSIDICLECTENQNKWVLVDMNCLSKLFDYLTLKSYCGNCK
jgi:hypothetical protein